MTDAELLRALRKLARQRGLALELLSRRGKGAHRLVVLGVRRSTLPSPGELKTGTLRSILKDLGLDLDDLRSR